jgi:hypothetical protein
MQSIEGRIGRVMEMQGLEVFIIALRQSGNALDYGLDSIIVAFSEYCRVLTLVCYCTVIEFRRKLSLL